MSDLAQPARPDAPHSGVFRTIYFLALAAVAFFAVLTGVRGFYSPPEGDSLFPSGFENSEFESDFQEAEADRADYNRNVTLIFTAASAAVFSAAILGLGSRFNPLRAGLLLGGLIIFLTAMGFWASASDKWIGFLMTLANFGALAGCILWLDEGLPIKPREPPHRLQPADIAPHATPGPPPADVEPSAPAPSPVEPPPGRTEPPPPMSGLPRE